MQYLQLCLCGFMFLGHINLVQAVPVDTKVQNKTNHEQLAELTNYQVNTATMISAGLPNAKQFKLLQTLGVTSVIDLLPGDRSEEASLVTDLGLNYFNVPVVWEQPTLANFAQYIEYMKQAGNTQGKVLTHCRLNWRAGVFTYLYRTTQLHEDEDVAKADLAQVWQPNPIWQQFIDDVKAQYQ
jgi:protein tyrosine phosphatase (PTP) superfamily phosphohydrolase (DUF442 family)